MDIYWLYSLIRYSSEAECTRSNERRSR